MKAVKAWVSCVLVLVGSVLAAGCGNGLNEVKGTVLFEDRPVAGLEVQFEPVDPATGTDAIGYTQADGSYVLHYPGEKTGAPAGEYVVRIRGGETDPESGKKARIAARFNSKSELTATVKSGENVFDFKVSSK